jgi:acetyl esterase/lipase
MKTALPCLLFLTGSLLAAPKETARTDGDFEISEVKNIAYTDAKDADPKKQLLDLYLPKGQKDFPVVMWVYGGGWSSGDKDVKLYGEIGRLLARKGIGAAVINYRLAPDHPHPEQIQDVARAFAWLHANVEKHGGRKDQIFVSGHSAGGHLVALLASDEQYLRAEKLHFSDIKGVIAVSGVYLISGKISLGMFERAFGSDKKVWAEASPLNHVTGDHPPFLILYGSRDVKPMREYAEEMAKALTEKKCSAKAVEIEDHGHIQMVQGLAKEDDPSTQAMLTFIAKLRAAPARE